MGSVDDQQRYHLTLTAGSRVVSGRDRRRPTGRGGQAGACGAACAGRLEDAGASVLREVLEDLAQPRATDGR